jgi:hypothetical protein
VLVVDAGVAGTEAEFALDGVVLVWAADADEARLPLCSSCSSHGSTIDVKSMGGEEEDDDGCAADDVAVVVEVGDAEVRAEVGAEAEVDDEDDD